MISVVIDISYLIVKGLSLKILGKIITLIANLGRKKAYVSSEFLENSMNLRVNLIGKRGLLYKEKNHCFLIQ
jgi:hypothetical protein